MRITIGLPFFNNRTTLPNAIRAVFAQSFADWELLLVDDGSTDGSLDIARAVADRRVKVVSDGTNLGLPARLNEIVQLARGEYIARMDADDLMHPDRLQRQVAFLNANPAVDIISTGIYSIDGSLRPTGKRGGTSPAVTARGLLAHRWSLHHPAVMARAAWCRRNPYDCAYRRSQDYELWCRAHVNGMTTFGMLEEPLHLYQEAESVSLHKMLVSYQADRRVLLKYGPRLGGWYRTGNAIAKTYLKALLWRVFAACGQGMRLVSLRNECLSRDELATVRAIVERITGTPVPGLDSAKTCEVGLPHS